MEQPIDRTEEKKQEATELTEEILALKEKTEQAARTIHENKKKATHIERSNTWKAAAFLGKIKTVFMRMLGLETHHEQQKQIAQLEKRVKESEQELFEAKETVRKLKLQDTELNRNEVYQFMRDLKNEGELTSFIDHFIEEKSKQQANYKEALTYAARLYMNDEEAYRNVMYANILSGLTIEEIPEFMIRAGLSSQPIPLRRAASFRGSLNMRMRQKQLQDALPEWELDDKRRAYAFAEKLGVPIPEIDENHYTVETIPFKDGAAIKPADAAGARGVYLAHGQDDIYDVRNSIKFAGWDKLKEKMQQDLQSGAVPEDEWMMEQLIYENEAEKIPARDVKFYCFYGKVGIILEIVRDPEIRQCWWTADGERIATGKYDESLFAGGGVFQEELEMAEKISREIPAPFIRIDFLRGENGLVLGEFTPKPGNYDEFDNETDAWLGDYFLDAQGRLTNDLLNGKQFEAFMSFRNKAAQS